jgi:hypothetical protein
MSLGSLSSSTPHKKKNELKKKPRKENIFGFQHDCLTTLAPTTSL